MLKKKKKEFAGQTRRLVDKSLLSILEGKPVSLSNSHDNQVPGEFLFQPKCYPENCGSPAGSSDVS